MEKMDIAVEARSKTGGKGLLSRLRKDKQVPAVIYGSGKPPESVSLSRKDFDLLSKRGSNIILTLKTGSGTDTAILKEVQYHVVSGDPIHVDLQRISMKEKIEIRVPVRVHGEAPGVKLHGALLDHSVRELAVKCLPADIPQEIAVDVSNLEHGAITLGDIKLPNGVESSDSPERILVHLLVPREEVAATPAAGAADAAASPEVIAKGKKDEAGAEGAAPAAGAKGAAPAGKGAAPAAGAKGAAPAAKGAAPAADKKK
ncbi:MAG: 50S ribosomal protein L25 [Elusimicrobia bacterium]|nr:50S ribosomal protein L25 [Elusimicrobiota bacterium]